VALVAPYWSFFEPSVPFDLRADRARLADEVAALLAPADCRPELIDGERSGALAGERLLREGADVLVLVVSTVAPPSFALALLDALPAMPLVVAAVWRPADPGEGLTHARIVAAGATVGTPQLTSVLHRRGRAHELVVGALGQPSLGDDLRAAIATARASGAPDAAPVQVPMPPVPAPAAGPLDDEAAAVAARLRGARIARVGEPIPGYDCVTCDPRRLREAIGIELVDVAPATVRDAYLAADPDRLAALEREARGAFALAVDVEADECLERSLRFAAGLEALDDELGVDAGAMNCHVPELRFAAGEPGITPCYALGRETTRGIPWSCAGDVVTAVALLTVKLLGGAALYHEIEALDQEAGEALLANSGEHDLAFGAFPPKPELRRNGWWEGDRRCGACACFGPAPGPATLVGFTVHAEEPSGFRYTVAEGSFGTRALAESGTPHAAFRFAGDAPVERAWADWARTGVNHHSVATPGHRGSQVAAVARELGVGCSIVS
jgi:hypothetical protein